MNEEDEWGELDVVSRSQPIWRGTASATWRSVSKISQKLNKLCREGLTLIYLRKR